MSVLKGLRVGNVIRWDLNNVSEFEDDFDYGYSDCPVEVWQMQEPERISPILLTEEWLLKFGFELSDNDLYSLGFIQNLLCFPFWFRIEKSLECNLEIVNKCDDEITSIHIINIKYVHQLQNLYFAITGYELEIKN